jgi:8-oxo-dGTP pyrophosphatase MutT (NUDIX family)
VNPLDQDLERYGQFWADDRPEALMRYRQFVGSSSDCCHRSHVEGHCTGSALIVSPDLEQTLLLYHPFLKRWLQPGGHADGDPDLLQVALREASEETGLATEQFKLFKLYGQSRVPLDLDIHPIPERGTEKAHYHYDLRFLLIADPQATLTPESEEMLLEWVPLGRVSQRTDEESVLRMIRKVQMLTSAQV